MGRNWHIWAEAQEVTLVGLLVLGAVRDRSHTADRKQGLMGNRKPRLGREYLADGSTAPANWFLGLFK